MAQAYDADVLIPTTGVDMVDTYGAMADVLSYVVNKGPAPVFVWFTSAAEIPAEGGIPVRSGDLITGTAAHVWVKPVSGKAAGVVAIGLCD